MSGARIIVATEVVMNQRNVDALEDYLAPDCVNHVTGEVGIPAYRSVIEWARQLQGKEGRNVIDDLMAWPSSSL